MGRKCAVPHCYTGYRKCTDKASLYKVPDDDFFLSKWQEAIAREDRPITPKDYVCEKHFKDDDILRKRIKKDVLEEYQRPRLKPDAIPSIFPDLPEFILKMTKKRRKLIVSVPEIVDISVEHDEKQQCDIKEEPKENVEAKKDNEINIDEIFIKTENDEVLTLPIEEIQEFDSTGAKLYQCNECSYKTKFSHNLRTHKVKHLSGEYAYMTCELCINYNTKWEITYVNHMKSKHGITLKEYFKCPFCIFKTKNKKFLARHCEKEHEKVENIEKEFKCVFYGCGYQTECQALLNIHNLTHDKLELGESHDVRTFSCKECHFQSNCKGSLVTHVKSAHRAGSNDETAKIIICKKPQLIDNEHFVFSCDECYFQTSTKAALTKHVNSAHISGTLVHETDTFKKKKLNCTQTSNHNKSTLKCSRCPYKSHSDALMKKHLSKHQMLPGNTHEKFKTILLHCTKCSFTTFSVSSLEDHQRDIFHCNECSYTTKNKSEYLNHTLTHRNTSVKVIDRNTSQDDSCGSSNIDDIQDMCVVTIKEECEFSYIENL